MSYLTYCDFYKEKDLFNSVTYDINEKSNVLGMMILIYMENKRSTSKMLQNTRYLVMSKLSVFQYKNDVYDKFDDPVRSPLQLYLIKKLISFYDTNNMSDIINNTKFGGFGSDFGDIYDKFAGADIRLPRILTTSESSNPINFSQALCEMYFTMFFNKNQDDPTHSSFQVLNKMLEGEKSFEDIMDTGIPYGYRPKYNDHQVAKYLVDHPHMNQFSRKAIEVGSVLCNQSKNCEVQGPLAHKIAQSKNNLNT